MGTKGNAAVKLDAPPREHDARDVLRVHRLRGGPGVGADRLVVTCPRSGLLVEVDRCIVCRHADSLSLDSDGYGSFVICRGRPPFARSK